jgi:hypothetical protein
VRETKIFRKDGGRSLAPSGNRFRRLFQVDQGIEKKVESLVEASPPLKGGSTHSLSNEGKNWPIKKPVITQSMTTWRQGGKHHGLIPFPKPRNSFRYGYFGIILQKPSCF